MVRPVRIFALLAAFALPASGCPRAAPPAPAPPADSPPEGLVVASLPAPGPDQRDETAAVSSVTWRGAAFPVGFHPLLTAGEAVHGSAPVGQLIDIDGQFLTDDDGAPRLCNGLDGASILAVEDELWSVVHGECHPGLLQLSRLAQDPATGSLSVVSTAPADLSAMRGGSLFCAAEVSPWGSHLAAEEYEADIRKRLPDGTVSDNLQEYNQEAWYLRGDLTGLSPYEHGWMTELTVAPGGETTFHKRYAMGRFSHELARVMPDRRTVYLSDDGTNSGFFVFVADREDDLRAGRLYASRWEQRGDEGDFALTWISLGHADEASVATALAEGVGFDDLFAHSDATPCPPGLTRVLTTHETGCLQVQPEQEALASRLETRRYAALRGATTELRKAEGMALDPATRRLWLAISKIGRGMEAAHAEWDLPGVDHVRLAQNPCGAVFELSGAGAAVPDTDGAAIDSSWIVTQALIAVRGVPRAYEGDLAENTCDLDVMANPDNLAFIEGPGLLVIAEDSHYHVNNVIWFVDPDTGEAARVMTIPYGGEAAGLNWFGDLGGWGYLTVSVQFNVEAGAPASSTGVLGPFPAMHD